MTTVPQHLRPWSIPYSGYAPIDVTPPQLQPAAVSLGITPAWITDRETDPTAIDYTDRRSTALIPFDLDATGRPLNPTGRTGRTGRALGRWAETAAADPIVIADAPFERWILLIKRADCGEWAIPGGKVDPGETAPAALVRELREETGVDLRAETPTVLTTAYVDDPRNTDHAWIVTTAALYVIEARTIIRAGSDAADAGWWPFDHVNQLAANLAESGEHLYAAHRPLLTLAASRV